MPIITKDGFYMFDLNEIVEDYSNINTNPSISYISYQQPMIFQTVPVSINNNISSYLFSISYPDEKFLPFVDYPNLCYISNFGRVYSLRSHNLIQGSFTKKGYLKIILNIDGGRNGKVKSYLIHRMVMMTFAPRPDYKDMQVNHINGDKTCNIYLPGDPRNNLEWCTNQENMDHAIRTGLVNTRGENSARALRTNKEIDEICQIMHNNPNLTGRQIAELTNHEYNSSFADLISNIRTGDNWREISQKYNIISPLSEQFDEQTVRQICEMLEQKFTYTEILIALNLPITEANRKRIYYIKNGDTYTEISSQYNIDYKGTFFSDQDVHDICKLLEQGYSTEEVLKRLNIEINKSNKEKIYHIKRGDYYSHITSQYNLPQSKRDMDENIVRKICQMLEDKIDIVDILKELQFEDCHKNRDKIYEIKRRHTYKNISKDYNF